uniref:Uncharacterized protein n=1 Tax=Sphaerodactylus townsendi TaxID=933632 RepID=A0ACB8G565_9SAUR
MTKPDRQLIAQVMLYFLRASGPPGVCQQDSPALRSSHGWMSSCLLKATTTTYGQLKIPVSCIIAEKLTTLREELKKVCQECNLTHGDGEDAMNVGRKGSPTLPDHSQTSTMVC